MNIKQYHPHLQKQWQQQITAYASHPHLQKQITAYAPVMEKFIDWDDPYKDIRFWKIIDFLRDFKLTK